jgi:2-C-methyl-D-erythritol 4-phosphate cytidylyltransferase/2-C-methyl-D-erythritol 2,4-cyclodiphosphate synthase
MPRCVALIVAAGRGKRLGGHVPKQYERLGGVAMLRHAVMRFTQHKRIEAVAVVIHADDRQPYDGATHDLVLLPPIVGGADRQESVRRGLETLASDSPDIVLVHDAARPFLSETTIDRVLDRTLLGVGAIPGLPVIDSLKEATEGNRIERAVARKGLWRAQTPQGFRFRELLDAHRRFAGAGCGDDAEVMALAGHDIALVPGDENNFKVTTPEDLNRARRLLAGSMETRVGTGFDVHRLVPGTSVTLCGVVIPHDRMLEGHSDADVALHSATDALLGALGDGDIGVHFPPSDPRWRGADSAGFLADAAARIFSRGGAISHLDLTLICERPKIAPYREAMRARLAAILGIDIARCSVKATTSEGLGFTGRCEGIAAQAVATVRLPCES